MLIIFLPCIKLGGKLLKLGDKLPGMGGKKKPGADLPDGHGTPGGQHLPDVNDSDAMDWSTKLGMARMITELHDQVDTPVGVLIPLLNSTIAARSQAVNGYRAEMTGPGVYDIVQFTKRKPTKVKEGFTTGKEDWDVDIANSMASFHDQADPYLDCSDVASSLNRSFPGGYILEITPNLTSG